MAPWILFKYLEGFLYIWLSGGSDWNPSHHILSEAFKSKPNCSWTTCHVKSHIGDVTQVLCTIRWAEWYNRNCSTGSTGCVPPALLRGALTIIEMTQAVCLYGPDQSSRRALRRSALHSQYRHNNETHKSNLWATITHDAALMSYILREHLQHSIQSPDSIYISTIKPMWVPTN